MNGLSDFDAGQIFQALGAVAAGGKIAADGEIHRDGDSEFLALADRWPDVEVVTVEVPGTDRLIWRASRFPWALAALEWLASPASDQLGSHLHWIQGLLYGYSPVAIAKYLELEARS